MQACIGLQPSRSTMPGLAVDANQVFIRIKNTENPLFFNIDLSKLEQVKTIGLKIMYPGIYQPEYLIVP